jgi:Rhodanese-related sulfurtransferase
MITEEMTMHVDLGKKILYLLPLTLYCPILAYSLEVGITPEIESVEVVHAGKKFLIIRNQDPDNTVNPEFARTSRKCPPYCIQPMVIAAGVETIGELEVLNYLKRISDGDNSLLVIDSRTPDWVAKGTIPGSVNIPWTSLNPEIRSRPIHHCGYL